MLIKKIKRNSLFNLIGSVVAGSSALPTIPFLVKNLGQEKFALLSIIWTIIGYMSLMEFGVGRSLLYHISKIRYPLNKKKLSLIINSGLIINLIFGIILTLIFIIIIKNFLKIFIDLEPAIHDEVYKSFIFAALSIIPLTINNSLRCCQEALGLFSISNLNKILAGSSLFLFPTLSVIINGPRLDFCALYILIGRILVSFISIFFLFAEIKYLYKNNNKDLPSLIQSLIFQGKKLFDFGKWIAICNFLGPILVYGDKFFITSLVPLDQIAYYTIPQELITRIIIIPTSICTALFPFFSNSDLETLSLKYKKAEKVITTFMSFLIIAFIFLWFPFSKQWISIDFAINSNTISVILLIGIFFNSIAQLPYTLIQSNGDSKMTALTFIFELSIYLILLPVMITKYGLTGAAFTWTMRIIIDFIIMRIYSNKFLLN
tara:strand:+ start:100 stop:1395 length:1296 start_codon:yes stop_codon:yes gene_type:complete